MSIIEVVAKPHFGREDLDWLTRLRHVRAHTDGPPRFTLVFPGACSSTQDVVRHVSDVCSITPAISFCLCFAVIVPEAQSQWFHVFLVPEHGFGAIIRLHDRLHVGPLADCLRQDMPYIPHLTVASFKDFAEARRNKAGLNAQNLAITGHLIDLEVHQREGSKRHCIARMPLARHRLFH